MDVATPPAGARVVVAEDETLIRMDLVEMLREEGFDVVGEAGDGATAVRLAAELEPDLVLMDVRMPGVDGVEAARGVGETSSAGVVLLTAFSTRDVVDAASGSGVLAYLVKPVSASDLVPALEVALARRAQLQELRGEVARLEGRLETRRLVERAKGRLMAERGLTEPEAYRVLQRASMDGRTSLLEVARVVLDEGGDARG